uniref:FZ domain-containing protein n=1 Tax=Zooxanthella nutricula TaxID=1333877 RepID=A0A7S2PVM3_9DINO
MVSLLSFSMVVSGTASVLMAQASLDLSVCQRDLAETIAQGNLEVKDLAESHCKEQFPGCTKQQIEIALGAMITSAVCSGLQMLCSAAVAKCYLVFANCPRELVQSTKQDGWVASSSWILMYGRPAVRVFHVAQVLAAGVVLVGSMCRDSLAEAGDCKSGGCRCPMFSNINCQNWIKQNCGALRSGQAVFEKAWFDCYRDEAKTAFPGRFDVRHCYPPDSALQTQFDDRVCKLIKKMTDAKSGDCDFDITHLPPLCKAAVDDRLHSHLSQANTTAKPEEEEEEVTVSPFSRIYHAYMHVVFVCTIVIVVAGQVLRLLLEPSPWLVTPSALMHSRFVRFMVVATGP